MANVHSVWGIDVGRCALKAIRMRPGADGKVEIIGQEYIEHPLPSEGEEPKRFQLVHAALERFLAKHDVSNDKVVIGVPGQHTLARFSKLPPVEPKKIPDIVQYEADQQIPFDLDEVIWDFQTFQEEDSPDIEVGIFAIKRELVREYLLPFQQAGIEPVAVQSGPLAIYNALSFEQRLETGASVLLDIGADNTNLIVATQSGLWTRTIPMGGNRFTDALVKGFKLPFAKAENLKRTAASSKYARQVFQAMRPVFAELVQELSRSLGFYRSTHRDVELKRVVAMGNASKLPGLGKYLQQNLQLPVEKPELLKKATFAEGADANEIKEQMPTFVVAYGLGLQGLELIKGAANITKIRSNLLPPEIVKQVVWRKKQPYFAAAAACLLLATGIIWFRRQSDLSTLQANAGDNPPASLDARRADDIIQRGVSGVPPREEARTLLAAAKSLQQEMAQYRNAGEDEKQKAQQILELQRNRLLWPRMLAAIHAALPAPDAALRNARTPEEFVKAIRDNPQALAREGREQIFIEQFHAEYMDNVDEVDLLDVVTGEPTQTIAAEGASPRKGFIVTLLCRTPHSQRPVRFVAETIKPGLIQHGRAPGRGFYINRVVLTEGRTYSEKPEDRGPPTGRGRGRGRGGRGGRPPERKSTEPSKFDPVTDEPMDDDWVFELKLDIVLEDLPQPKEDRTA